jgi:hypothetical protein
MTLSAVAAVAATTAAATVTPVPAATLAMSAADPRRRPRVAARTRAAAPAALGILALCGDPLSNIFDLLSPTPAALRHHGTHVGGVHALSEVCKYFDAFYRTDYVTTLTFTGNLPVDRIARCLSRFPRAAALCVRYSAASVFEFSRALAAGGDAERASKVTKVVLERVHVSDGGLLELVTACSQLEELHLHTCHGWGDDGLLVVISVASETLKVLRVDSADQFSDAAGQRLGLLTRLESLSIAGCQRLTSDTFQSLAALKRMRSLRLAKSAVSDAALCAVLPAMTLLTSLDVSECDQLSPAVLCSLPASLVSLRVNCTKILTNEVPSRTFERSPRLTEVYAREAHELTAWWPFLGPIATRLRVLDLWRSNISGSGCHDVLPRMTRLERLTLGECRKVSDEVALAVSSLESLSRIDLSSTNVTAQGAHALAACRYSLTEVDLCNCRRIAAEGQKEKVREHLTQALHPGATILLG